MGQIRGRVVVGLMLAVVGLVAPMGPASAWVAPTGKSESGGAMAQFEGRTIDLSRGWQGADVCIVYDQASVECFRNADDVDAGVASLTTPSGFAVLSLSCPNPLRLYENNYYGGRELWFYSRGFWQNLGDFGFNNQLSSYYIGDCTSYLAENNNGGGAWHPGATAPWSAVPWMSSGWDNRVSSIYIT